MTPVELVEELRAEPREVARARRALTRALRQWGVDGDAFDVALLLTSELVTNAIRHGSAPVRLRARVSRRELRVEVHDAARGPLGGPRTVSWDSPGGRGLKLVDTLADRWGCRRVVSGKRVWFELDLTG